MVQYSLSEKLEMMAVYGDCKKNARKARELYILCLPNIRNPSKTTFLNIDKNVLECGAMVKPTQDRARVARDEAHIIGILAKVRCNPEVSLNDIPKEVDISKSSSQRILKEHKFHAYRPYLVQGLRESD